MDLINRFFLKKMMVQFGLIYLMKGWMKKLLLRSDGTSVYMTQDLGTAYKRYKDNPEMKGLIYTVGNEQDYHFNVLFKVLKKLGFEWSNHLSHLSYGMVDLPSGKMKSREGTVVDADELILEMISNASKLSSDLGKLDDLSSNDKKYIKSYDWSWGFEILHPQSRSKKKNFI